MKRAICLIVFSFQLLSTYSQRERLDSLLMELTNREMDTMQVNLLQDISLEYLRINQDSLKYYLNRSIEKANEIQYSNGLIEGYRLLGIYHNIISEFDQAVDYFVKGYKAAEEVNDSLRMTGAINNIGISYKKKGDYFNAVKYLNRAINLEELTYNQKGKSFTLNNLGSVYQEIGEYTRAIDYYLQSLAVKEEIGIKEGFFSSNSNIASIYFILEDFEKSIQYYGKALASDSSLNKWLGLSKLYSGLGNAHMELNHIDSAKFYYNKSLLLALKQDDKNREANTNYQLGNLYLKQKNYQEAFKYIEASRVLFNEIENLSESIKVLTLQADGELQMGNWRRSITIATKAVDLAKKQGSLLHTAKSYRILYESSLALKNKDAALEYLRLFKVYDDSIKINKNEKELLAFENRAQLRELQNENTRLANQNALNEALISKNQLELERQNLLIFGIILMIIFMGGYIYILYRYMNSRKQSYLLLKQKNQEITLQADLLKSQTSELVTKQEKILNKNKKLKKEVKVSSLELTSQNERLREYAFTNAHLVRAPLARILGLVDLLMEDELTEEQRKEFRAHLKDSAIELDLVIRNFSEFLGKDLIID